MRAALPWLIWLTAVGLAAIFIILCMAANQADARARGESFQCSYPDIPDEFAGAFAVAAKRHMPVYFRNEVGACIIKTICWNESRFQQNAVSHAGAVGFCQIMPATARDLERRGWWRGKLRDVKDNTMASAAAWRGKWEFWVTPRTVECRTEMATASYNGGEGNVAEAQTLSGGALCWERIRAFLPQVTGRHAKETIDYVSRFWATWRKLRGYGL